MLYPTSWRTSSGDNYFVPGTLYFELGALYLIQKVPADSRYYRLVPGLLASGYESAGKVESTKHQVQLLIRGSASSINGQERNLNATILCASAEGGVWSDRVCRAHTTRLDSC